MKKVLFLALVLSTLALGSQDKWETIPETREIKVYRNHWPSGAMKFGQMLSWVTYYKILNHDSDYEGDEYYE